MTSAATVPSTPEALASLDATLAANAAFAGEVTGNGTSLHVEGGGKWGTGLHARSFCAFSGQEDLQFEAGGTRASRATPSRGVRSQRPIVTSSHRSGSSPDARATRTTARRPKADTTVRS